MTSLQATTETRIYVADLAEYNNGNLHGVWIDCEGKDAEDLQSEVSAMLKPGNEEFAIHDHEGLGSIGEYTPLSEIAELAELVEKHGAAFIAYADHVGGTEYARDSFEEAYMGEWDNEQAYAEDYFDQTMGVPDHLVAYIDYDKFTRDLFIDSMFSEDAPDGNVYVFVRM